MIFKSFNRATFAISMAAAWSAIAISSASAAVVDNTSLISPPGVYYGSGNANGNFAVDTENGVEIALRAHLAFVGNIVPSGNWYQAPVGLHDPGHALWNFDYSVFAGTQSLDGTNALITITDFRTGHTGSFNPSLVPDNAHPSSGTGYQNSENLMFGFVPGFDASANDLYKFDFTLTGGSLQAPLEVVAFVQIGSGVPEASTWAMLLLGFAGIGLLARRRSHRGQMALAVA